MSAVTEMVGQTNATDPEFMSAVTEMVGQTNATDPDTAFANLIYHM